MERSSSSSVISITSIVVLGLGCLALALAGSAAAIGADGVNAYWTNYYPQLSNWNLTEVGVFCSTWYDNEPMHGAANIIGLPSVDRLVLKAEPLAASA
ncbi:hypothetical protein REPUB_Repub06bG0037700 [Reevesia pubescens]